MSGSVRRGGRPDLSDTRQRNIFRGLDGRSEQGRAMCRHEWPPFAGSGTATIRAIFHRSVLAVDPRRIYRRIYSMKQTRTDLRIAQHLDCEKMRWNGPPS